MKRKRIEELNLIKREICVRNAKFSKPGLLDLMNYISDYYRGKEDVIMLEVGSFAGDSGEIFAKYVDKLYCIDPFSNGYDEKDSSSDADMIKVEKQFDIVSSHCGNIEKMKMTSEEASKLFEKKSLDIIYLDAGHFYDAVVEDINYWVSKVKIGGFLCFHDYGSGRFPDVQKAVNELLGEPDERFQDTSCVFHIQ